MRIERVSPHSTTNVCVWCSRCGDKCWAGTYADQGKFQQLGGRNVSAYADLDAAAGTYLCYDCLPKEVLGCM